MSKQIPFKRNNTYVAGVSEVAAEDLNDLQDKLSVFGPPHVYQRLWDADTKSGNQDPVGDAVLDWLLESGGAPALSFSNLPAATADNGNFQAMRFENLSIATDETRVYRKWPLHQNPDKAIQAYEFYFHIGGAVASLEVDVFMGLHNDMASVAYADLIDDAQGSFIWVTKRAADSNFFAHIGNTAQGVTESVDLGVAPTASVFHRITIVHHGRDTPLGDVNGIIEIYVDGTLEHTFDDDTGAFAQPDTAELDSTLWTPAIIGYTTAANAIIPSFGPFRSWWWALDGDAG